VLIDALDVLGDAKPRLSFASVMRLAM
jgi:hypothetical protein